MYIYIAQKAVLVHCKIAARHLNRQINNKISTFFSFNINTSIKNYLLKATLCDVERTGKKKGIILHQISEVFIEETNRGNK